MDEWRRYVRSRLRLTGIEKGREREIVEELASLLEDSYREALARGSSEEAAAQYAREQVPDWEALASELVRPGPNRLTRRAMDIIEERERAMKRRGGASGLLADFAQDVRFALRGLGRTPNFTFLALVTIALGIGASTAIFSVVNGVLLAPLPYPESDRIVVFSNTYEARGTSSPWLSPDDYLDWREQNRSMELIGMSFFERHTYTGGDEPVRVNVQFMTEDVLPILGGEASLGRIFSSDEYVPEQDGVVLLDHGFWERTLGADSTVIGHTLSIDGYPLTIVGVMAEDWRQLEPRNADVLIPWEWERGPQRNGGSWVKTIGRRRGDVGIEGAQADLSSIAERLALAHPRQNGGQGVLVTPLYDSLLGSSRSQLLMFLASAGFVLLIACLNVANMTLARLMTRSRELAVRAAMGAGRLRILRQLLVESLVLSGLGGVLGSALGLLTLKIFVARSPAQILPRMEAIGIDGTVLVFAVGAALLSGVIFGVLPVLALGRHGTGQRAFQGAQRVVGTTASRAVRDGLIVVEVSLAIVLLVGSGLLLRSFWALGAEDPGFATESRLSFSVPISYSDYPEPADMVAYADRATLRFASIPGVESVAATPALPIRGGWDTGAWGVELEGIPVSPDEDYEQAHVYRVKTGHLQTLGIPLISGRDLLPTDGLAGAKVALVSESFVQRHYPNETPMGKQIRLHGSVDDPPWAEIVGVVGDVQEGLGRETQPQVYTPLDQQARHSPNLEFVIRTLVPPLDVAPAVRAELRLLDPNQPMVGVMTLDQLIERETAVPRFRTSLMVTFGVASMLLAMVGLYGVVSFTVAQRTREIGVRMALGATGDSVLKLIMRAGLPLVLLGVAIGVGLALSFSQILDSMLFEVASRDLAVFVGAPVLMLCTAIAAMFVPALRAARLDPLRALGDE